MKYGYARVTINDCIKISDELEPQQNKLVNAGASMIIWDAVYNPFPKESTPNLNNLIDNLLMNGDTLIVSSLDRISPSKDRLLVILKRLFDLKIGLNILDFIEINVDKNYEANFSFVLNLIRNFNQYIDNTTRERQFFEDDAYRRWLWKDSHYHTYQKFPVGDWFADDNDNMLNKLSYCKMIYAPWSQSYDKIYRSTGISQSKIEEFEKTRKTVYLHYLSINNKILADNKSYDVLSQLNENNCCQVGMGSNSRTTDIIEYFIQSQKRFLLLDIGNMNLKNKDQFYFTDRVNLILVPTSNVSGLVCTINEKWRYSSTMTDLKIIPAKLRNFIDINNEKELSDLFSVDGYQTGIYHLMKQVFQMFRNENSDIFKETKNSLNVYGLEYPIAIRAQDTKDTYGETSHNYYILGVLFRY